MRAPLVAGPESLVVARQREQRGTEREPLLWRTGRAPHHDAYTTRSLRYLFLLAGLWGFNLLDALTTLHGVGGAGWAAEANPLLRHLALRLGSVGFFLYKAGLITVVAVSLGLFYRALERAAHRARTPSSMRHLMRWVLTLEIATLALALLYATAALNNLFFAGVL
jgi:hypothetical protein